MGNPEIQNILQNLLGKNAIDNAHKVDDDFRKLTLAVSYLALQIEITKRWCDEEGKEHVDTVINKTKEILNEAKEI